MAKRQDNSTRKSSKQLRHIPLKQFREETVEGFNPYKQRTWTKGIYDRSANNYCGRTPRRWWLLLIFFTCFYTVLIIMWIICYTIFNTRVSEDTPRWFFHQPGLSVAPCDDENAKFCRIEFGDDFKKYIKDSRKFLEKYGKQLPADRFGDCSRVRKFGYPYNQPCIFLKLNRVIGFVADTYETGADLPGDAPTELKTFINTLPAEQRKHRIWLSCTPSDDSVLVQYYPEIRSFDAALVNLKKMRVAKEDTESESRFYDAKDFERIIAVKLSRFPRGESVKIYCNVWAKNIVIFKKEGHGAGTALIRVKILS